ncbi:MAG: hypothetical protein ABFD77_02620 [Thermotogota bacterium]
MDQMFEKAARQKVRFPHKGQVTVEDLWDLSVTALDGIYKTLKGEQKKADGESLLDRKTPDSGLELQIAVVTYIVKVKMAEADAKLKEADKKARKERLLELLAKKEDEALASKSTEEIRALIAGLD